MRRPLVHLGLLPTLCGLWASASHLGTDALRIGPYVYQPDEPQLHDPQPSQSQLRLHQIFHFSIAADVDVGPGASIASSQPVFKVLDLQDPQEYARFVRHSSHANPSSLRCKAAAALEPWLLSECRQLSRFGPVCCQHDSEEQTNPWEFQVAHQPESVPMWSTALRKLPAAARRANGIDSVPLRNANDQDGASLHIASAPIRVQSKPIRGPNMGDPTTIRNLGQMSLNSYFEPSASAMQNKWENVPGFNQTERFGWLDNGIRGYVFSDAKREVVVLAIKGSGSPDTPVPSGPTSEQDKFNDNIMFSCCCAASFWYPICQCHNTKDKTCNRACILGQSNFNSSYYNIAQSIYKSVETWYPRKASIWVTGHSLGGSLASLLALTNDVPAVAFEAPGDMLYAGRIGLLPALPPRSGTTRPDYTQFFKTLPIYHIGNTQDPIFYGECTAWTSVCWRGGISMESKCHVGKECIYNDASKVASSSLDAPPEAQGFDMKYHGMGFVLDHFLKAWDRVPECKPQEDCQECTEWREV